MGDLSVTQLCISENRYQSAFHSVKRGVEQRKRQGAVSMQRYYVIR